MAWCLLAPGLAVTFLAPAEEEPRPVAKCFRREQYRMYEYVTEELPAVISKNFPVDTSRASVFGHSMGGHGALVVAFR